MAVDTEKANKRACRNNHVVVNWCKTRHSCLSSLTILVIVLLFQVIECSESEYAIKDTSISRPKRVINGPASNLPVFNLTIPVGDPSNACIRIEASFIFNVSYIAQAPNGTYLRWVEFVLNEKHNVSYSGWCQPDRNMIELSFLNGWRLELYFLRQSTTFLFNHVFLYYQLKGSPGLFPYSMHEGAQSEAYETVYINSTLLQSYTCHTGIRIDLGEVVVWLQQLHVEPYFNKRPNLAFDSNVQCSGDEQLQIMAASANYISNMWSIVLVSMFVLLIFGCCSLFVILKARNDRRADNKNASNTSGASYETMIKGAKSSNMWIQRV